MIKESYYYYYYYYYYSGDTTHKKVCDLQFHVLHFHVPHFHVLQFRVRHFQRPNGISIASIVSAGLTPMTNRHHRCNHGMCGGCRFLYFSSSVPSPSPVTVPPMFHIVAYTQTEN